MSSSTFWKKTKAKEQILRVFFLLLNPLSMLVLLMVHRIGCHFFCWVMWQLVQIQKPTAKENSLQRLHTVDRKKHVRLSFQSPFSILFCAKTTKIIFTKNSFANVVKKHVRLPSQPPFSFLFCAKTKKTVLTKNPFANDVTKHVRLIFSPTGEIL